MRKKHLLSIFLLSLAGCAGDKLAFNLRGEATVNQDRICIVSSIGDSLDYYSLTSSEENHQVSLSAADNASKKYPDTCIPFSLRDNSHYELIYEMKGKKYRFEFITDAHSNVTKTYAK